MEWVGARFNRSERKIPMNPLTEPIRLTFRCPKCGHRWESASDGDCPKPHRDCNAELIAALRGLLALNQPDYEAGIARAAIAKATQ